jgi:hypothetical protein
MDSSRIGKIEKARRYAEEARERITFAQFRATIRGDNDSHDVAFDNGRWTCNCHYFDTHGDCSHTMAMQRVLGEMIPEPLATAA